MDAYDPKKAQRVWQRVQSAQLPTASQTEPEGLIIRANMAKAIYLKLAQQGLSNEAPVLRKLAEKKQGQIACLKGMRLLSAGRPITAVPPPASKETPLAALRRCFSIEAHALREYELHTPDREYGPVWADLAAEQRQLCRALLELLGRLER